MTNVSLVTHDELKRILGYDPESGIFRWKVSNSRRVSVGDVAGSVNSLGYGTIRINKKLYLSHRIAWFYVHGEWPKDQIDHINGIKDDNRIENLREATNSENGMNKTKKSNNASGLKGVYWNKEKKKWSSEIQTNLVRFKLGYFKSKEDAYTAYCKAAEELHGEFANV